MTDAVNNPGRFVLQQITKNPVLLRALENLFNYAQGVSNASYPDISDEANNQAIVALDSLNALSQLIALMTIAPPILPTDKQSSFDFYVPPTPPSQDINALYMPRAVNLPTQIGQLTIEATNNTTLTFRYKGSDGTVRSNALTLT